MRVTVGEISKMVQAAMLVEGPTSAARDSGRRGGGSERTMDRWARAAANGGLDREKRQSASWNQSDDARMGSIGTKVIRALRTTIAQGGVEIALTSLDQRTLTKMSGEEIVGMVDDALRDSDMIARSIAKIMMRRK